jgi:multidrug resistance efflux pump
MAREQILDITDCTPMRQTLLARPPKVMHGAVVLMVGLLVAAVTWSLATEADLVVRASGRVRPEWNPDKPISDVEEESRVSSVYGGRVTEVHVKEGREVRKGQVLLRFDTEMLENEISRVKRSIETDRTELSQLHELEKLAYNEFAATQAKTQAELAQVVEQIGESKKRRSSDVELARLALVEAQINLGRTEKLVVSKTVTDAQLREARRLTSETAVKFEAAKIPVDESRVDVLRKALLLNQQTHATRCGQLGMQMQAKQGSIEAIEFELANLHLRREHAVLTSPTDGMVTAMRIQVGDVVQPGAAVVTITEQRGFRIDLNVSSDQVGHLCLGMPARVRLDAYDYQVYGTLSGTVIYIAPDTQLSALPDGKTVASYTVRIALSQDFLEEGEHRGDVKLGMTGTAEIITEKESLFLLLVRGIRRKFSLG